MTKIILLVSIGLLILVFGPMLTIWALNVLFPTLHIPITLSTWFAVIVLGSFTVHKGSK